jgi:hypothetical protein
VTNQGPQGTGTILGRVTTVDGEPVVDAAVMIGGTSPSHFDIAALTNEQGEYRFADLVPGDYTLVVNVEGYPLQSVRVEVEAGRVATASTRIS